MFCGPGHGAVVRVLIRALAPHPELVERSDDTVVRFLSIPFRLLLLLFLLLIFSARDLNDDPSRQSSLEPSTISNLKLIHNPVHFRTVLSKIDDDQEMKFDHSRDSLEWFQNVVDERGDERGEDEEGEDFALEHAGTLGLTEIVRDRVEDVRNDG
jgi:hypothetical protein